MTNAILAIALFFVAIFIVYPLYSLFVSAFFYEQYFTLDYFSRFFNNSFFYNSLIRSFYISISATFFSIIIGVFLAYMATFRKIKYTKFLNIAVVISMMSPPFLGAYSWIILLGRRGYITTFLRGFGVNFPDIYGFFGIVLVMTLQGFPLIYLFTKAAFSKVDFSVVYAAKSLGTNNFKIIFKIIIPLILPTVLGSSLLVFTDAFTDFGTPALIGEGYIVMPVLIFGEFMSELGGRQNFASAMSVIMVVITGSLFFVQRKLISKNIFYTANGNKVISESIKNLPLNIIMHIIIFGIVAVAILPQGFVIFSSFRRTSGPLFTQGFSLDSYTRVFRTFTPLTNTFIFSIIAIAVIIVIVLSIVYVNLNKKDDSTNKITGLIDFLLMIPMVIPGSVIGLSLILAFNTGPFRLVGTSTILIIAFVVRRLPYTLRSCIAYAKQINPYINEAAQSLGSSQLKAFTKTILIIMIPGIASGAILSFISIINELNATIMLFTVRSRTMTIAIYQEIMRASYGTASALATILIFFTVLAVLAITKLRKDGNVL